MTVERAIKAAKDKAHGKAGNADRQNARNGADKPRHATLTAALGGQGTSLPDPVRVDMQGRFATDFSHVRVHADAQAGAVADAIGARAFTVGNHIIFGSGRFATGDADGIGLIAHELTHVVQQQPMGRDVGLPATLAGLPVSRPGDAAEREATSVAAQVLRGETFRVQERSEMRLQADWDDMTIGALAGAVVGGVVAGPVGAVVGAAGGAAIGAAVGGAGAAFPTYAQITGDADVTTKVTAAWASTEAAANATSRREEGFWIRKNMGTGKFEFTTTILGPSIGPAQTGSVQLGTRPADTNAGTASAIVTVGSFHTHTPTAFRTVGRPIGPSDADNSVDTSDDVVGVVYDYVESPAGSGGVPAGHPIGSTAQVYHSGPDSRQKA
jgi:hypothetical protein